MTTIDTLLAEIRGRAERLPPSMRHASQRDVPRLLAAVEAALKVADDGEHGALRWQDPLPVPEYVHLIREAITTALTEETHHG